MGFDVYSSAGKKTGTMDLPASLVEERVNKGLIHQAVLMQAANEKKPVAHVKRRGEVVGSTKKLFQQKGTGRARRGPLRSPLMRGGGKAWGPRNTRTFARSMPKAMRHAAVRASLNLQLKSGALLGLEGYDGKEIKTKVAHELLKKLPVDIGRTIIFVLPEKHPTLEASVRNIAGVQTMLASYLNVRDLVHASRLIFVGNAMEKADEVFGKKTKEKVLKGEEEPVKVKKPKRIKSAADKSSKKSA